MTHPQDKPKLGKLVACSGACWSGKTTTMRRLAVDLPRISCLYEVIRDSGVQSIDELRKDANLYLEYQITWISRKITQENDALLRPGLTLCDRSLADSVYYYTRYVDKTRLTTANLCRYYMFLNNLLSILQSSCRYERVLVFTPIAVPDAHQDELRPKNLQAVQQEEHRMILETAKALCGTGRVLEVSAVTGYEEIYGLCLKLS